MGKKRLTAYDILPALKSGVSLQRRMTYQRSIHPRSKLQGVLECCYKEVALDTNIFSYYFQKHPAFGPKSREIFLALMEDRLRATTSIITLIELLSQKAPLGRIKVLHEEILTMPNLTIFPVENKVALEAAKIRRKYPFRVPDAVQLATAIFAKSHAFITNDERLKRFKRLPVVLLKSL